MYSSLWLLLAIDFSNLFSSLVFEPGASNCKLQVSLVILDCSNISQAPVNTKTLKVIIGVMILVSYHEIWQLKMEKVERDWQGIISSRVYEFYLFKWELVFVNLWEIGSLDSEGEGWNSKERNNRIILGSHYIVRTRGRQIIFPNVFQILILYHISADTSNFKVVKF